MRLKVREGEKGTEKENGRERMIEKGTERGFGREREQLRK
jgi:hypothetical protein